MRNAHFKRFQKPTFTCEVCKRRTRDTGQGVDHLCEDCYEIAGIDNMINDNGWKPGDADFEEQREELDRRLKHIGKLGGDVDAVKRINNYAFPPEPAPESLAARAKRRGNRKRLEAQHTENRRSIYITRDLLNKHGGELHGVTLGEIAHAYEVLGALATFVEAQR